MDVSSKDVNGGGRTQCSVLPASPLHYSVNLIIIMIIIHIIGEPVFSKMDEFPKGGGSSQSSLAVKFTAKSGNPLGLEKSGRIEFSL